MYEALLAALAAEELEARLASTSFTFMLLCVPEPSAKPKRELLVVAPGERFVGRALDRVGLLGIEQA